MAAVSYAVITNRRKQPGSLHHTPEDSLPLKHNPVIRLGENAIEILRKAES